jgi:hypothetical protein
MSIEHAKRHATDILMVADGLKAEQARLTIKYLEVLEEVWR